MGAGKRNQLALIYNVGSAADPDNPGRKTPVLTLYRGATSGDLYWVFLKETSTAREVELAKTFSPTAGFIAEGGYDANIVRTQQLVINGVSYSIDGVTPDDRFFSLTMYLTRLDQAEAPSIVDASTLPTGEIVSFDQFGTMVPSGVTLQNIVQAASGYSGYSGIKGTAGTPGTNGNVGPVGPTGTSGFSGVAGVSGFSGISGIAGAQGTSGFSGIVGTSGFSGVSGFSGKSGYSGVNGFSGFSGIVGASGFSGTSGFSGVSGASVSGFSGYSGKSGYSGMSGFSGYSGVATSGFSGVSGFSGISGFSGYSGKSGWSGYSGAPGGTSGCVQYSDGTKLAGSSGFTYDGISHINFTKLNAGSVSDPVFTLNDDRANAPFCEIAADTNGWCYITLGNGKFFRIDKIQIQTYGVTCWNNTDFANEGAFMLGYPIGSTVNGYGLTVAQANNGAIYAAGDVKIDGKLTITGASSNGRIGCNGIDGLGAYNAPYEISFGSLDTINIDLFENSGFTYIFRVFATGGFAMKMLSSAPSSPTETETYYDSTLHKMRTWDGSAWQNHW